jgi:uncharacterized membrane protein
MPGEGKWTDKTIEDDIGRLLQAGVFLSAFVVFCGACIYLVRHGRSPVDYHTFHSLPPDSRTVAGIVRGALSLRGRGIIQLGLLLLIATPIARVAFSILGFAEERDRMYVLFAAIVLAVLLYSLIGSA